MYDSNPAKNPDAKKYETVSIQEVIDRQLAYTEIFVTDCLWPDFDQAELERAITAYNRLERRFGGVKQAKRRSVMFSRRCL